MKDQKAAKQVAIIAVHGVADQQPRASARRIANLLQNLDQAGEPLYDPFIEREIRLSVRPFRIPNPSSPWKRPDLELARDALKGYEGEPASEVFETIRVEGQRADGTKVHVYECYWADLSRLGVGFARFFGELYQLLFHLTRVGYHTVQASARARGWTWPWWLYERLVNLTSALLTWPIPVIHLILGAILVMVSSIGMLNAAAPWLQRAIVVAITGVVCWVGLAIPLRSRVKRFGTWLLVSLAPLAVLLPLAFYWSGELASGQTVLPANLSTTSELSLLEDQRYRGVAQVGAGHLQIFATLIALLCAGGVALIIQAYSRRRPGVGWFGAGLGISALGMVLHATWATPNAPSNLICSLLRVAFGPELSLTLRPDHVLGWLRLSWGALLFSLFLTEFVGWILVVPASHPHRIVRRTVWTTSITVVLPIFGFVIATPAVWAVLSLVAQRTLPLEFGCDGRSAAELASGLLVGELARFLALLFAAGALAGSLGAWGLFATVWSEVRPPRLSRSQANRLSGSLGAWLDHGFKLVGVAGFLLYISTLAAGAGSIWLALGGSLPWPDIESAERIILGLGTLLGGSTIGLLALRGRFNKVTGGFRNLLDVLLDVDNHLKDRPREATPRARIAGRYISLLRYLCTEGMRDGSSYDAIVIIAHSQGTVITADLLRLLQAERTRAGSPEAYDPALVRLGTSLPIYLFTMGSPLGQLYGLRFPDLYGWARNEDQPCSEWKQGDINGLQPDPDSLGVCQWVNAFRSGDYVGRQLWRHPRCEYRFNYPELLDESGPWPKELAQARNVSSDDSGRRIEFCIGPGAHTHYWDETAPEITGELDQLVVRAAATCDKDRR